VPPDMSPKAKAISATRTSRLMCTLRACTPWLVSWSVIVASPVRWTSIVQDGAMLGPVGARAFVWTFEFVHLKVNGPSAERALVG
jgi:hypothetical protein